MRMKHKQCNTSIIIRRQCKTFWRTFYLSSHNYEASKWRIAKCGQDLNVHPGIPMYRGPQLLRYTLGSDLTGLERVWVSASTGGDTGGSCDFWPPFLRGMLQCCFITPSMRPAATVAQRAVGCSGHVTPGPAVVLTGRVRRRLSSTELSFLHSGWLMS